MEDKVLGSIMERFFYEHFELDINNREAFFRLYKENFEKFKTSYGSGGSHHTWNGGYIDHMNDMLETAKALMKLPSAKHMPFAYQDLALVVLLHDIEKPFKHSDDPFYKNMSPNEVRYYIVEKYGFDLSPMHLNALKYAHGENEDYVKNERVMNELASYLHSCDIISARAHYNIKPGHHDSNNII